jgi:hypothetical protein
MSLSQVGASVIPSKANFCPPRRWWYIRSLISLVEGRKGNTVLGFCILIFAQPRRIFLEVVEGELVCVVEQVVGHFKVRSLRVFM